MEFSMRSYPHAGEPEFWQSAKDDSGSIRSFGIRVHNSDERGTFYLNPKAAVKTGDVWRLIGSLTGPGRVSVLYYDDSSDRIPYDGEVIKDTEGAFNIPIEIPEGDGAIEMRVDFRLWNVDLEPGQTAVSELIDLQILAPGEGDEVENLPDQVVLSLPDMMPQNVILSWADADFADFYEVFFSRDNAAWQKQGETNGTTWAHYFEPDEAGVWYFRIDSSNEFGTTLGEVASSTIEISVPDKVEIIDPPSGSIEIGELTIFWQAAERAESYIVYLAQEAQEWELIGETPDLFYTLDMSERELGEWGFRVDSVNDHGQTDGDVYTFILGPKEWKPQEVYPVQSVPFSGFLWPGGIISLQIPNLGTEDEPFYGIPVAEGQALDITGDFLGHVGVIQIHGLGQQTESNDGGE